MTDLTLIDRFSEAARSLASLQELEAVLDAFTHELGFDYFALVQHVDLSNRQQRASLIALSSYPAAWIEHYINRKLVTDDPVHLASHRTNVGFTWSKVPSLIHVTRAHRDLRDTTCRAGITDGFTVPAHIPGETNASCSFAMANGRALPETNLQLAQLLGTYAFEAARRLVRGTNLAAPVPRLSPRQLECLIWVARGKGNWEIGQILGLSIDTVAEHLAGARRRYDVAQRTQLVMHAVYDGQFAISDALT